MDPPPATKAFGMVVITSVTARVIGRAVMGDEPFLRLPPFQVSHLVEYPLFALLRLATGISHVISPDTVYTRKLLRRGIDIDQPADPQLAEHRSSQARSRSDVRAR